MVMDWYGFFIGFLAVMVLLEFIELREELLKDGDWKQKAKAIFAFSIFQYIFVSAIVNLIGKI